MRYAISDEVWDVLGPMVQACKSPHGPDPILSDRMSFEAVLYWARVGCPWRDLPGDFGDWSAVSNRLRRRIDSGRMGRLFDRMTAQPACEGLRRVMIDSTIVRAHRHAAGARRAKGGRRATRSAARAAAGRRRSSSSPRTRTA